MAGWGAGAALVLLPLVAMQLTDEVAWGAEDVAFAAALVLGIGIAYELAARPTRSPAYRGATGVALATAFVLVWANAAVGFVGSEDNPANLLFYGVLATGAAGAAIARFRPGGMARALRATAVAQVLAGAIALVAWPGAPGSGAGEVLALTGLFAALWLVSAWLFGRAVREQGPAHAAV